MSGTTSSHASSRAVRVAFALLAVATLTSWISPPVALALGLVFALTVGTPWADTCRKGAKRLLQISVVGLGVGLNLQALWDAGRLGFGFTVATIFGTLGLGLLLARWLRVEGQTGTLIAVGTSICGGSAIAAVGSVLGARSAAMSVALATVFVLNAIALFVFPPLGHALGLDATQFGIWSAIAIHDTSSVVGAAAKYGGGALEVATTVKLARALWIVPVALAFSLLGRGQSSEGTGRRIAVPWFIVAFVVAAALRTLWPVGEPVYDVLRDAARRGLTLTLFLIGAGLSRSALRNVGVRPLVQGILLWITVSVAGLIAVRTVLG